MPNGWLKTALYMDEAGRKHVLLSCQHFAKQTGNYRLVSNQFLMLLKRPPSEGIFLFCMHTLKFTQSNVDIAITSLLPRTGKLCYSQSVDLFLTKIFSSGTTKY